MWNKLIGLHCISLKIKEMVFVYAYLETNHVKNMCPLLQKLDFYVYVVNAGTSGFIM